MLKYNIIYNESPGNVEDSIKQFINKIVFTQNLNKLSNYLENISHFEKLYIKKNLATFLPSAKWRKGAELFVLFVKQWV